MRNLAVLLLACLAFGSCSSLSTEDRDRLAQFQRTAKAYWEDDRLGQALGQIERGLELEPDDYVLNTLKGAILLKQSPSSQGIDHRQLDEATAILARIYELRSLRQHQPMLLFNYALALQKQARRHAGEVVRLEALAARGVPSIDQGEIATNRTASETEFAQAEQLLDTLIDRGELLRLCHYHLLLAAHDRGDSDGITAHSLAYFKESAKAQVATESDIRRTNQPGFEQQQKRLLFDLRTEELEVRSLLAGYYYDRQEYEVALTMLDRVLELDPRRSTDYYNRGRVLLNLGRDADARADFRKFLATTELPATSDKAVFAAAQLAR
ncbi:MAG: tetratricopeptide repeat protein [Planctomycetes bacterium]|nr:tetratricopeptide repeat protein [Planctomycetota bacterium]